MNKEYPHESFMRKNAVTIADFSQELQLQLNNFDKKYGHLAPSKTLPNVLNFSMELADDMKEELDNHELAEDYSNEELCQEAIKTLLCNRSEGKCLLAELQMHGYCGTPTTSWKMHGNYGVRKESAVTKTCLIRFVS